MAIDAFEVLYYTVSIESPQGFFIYPNNLAYVRTLYLSEACSRRVYAHRLADQPDCARAYARRHPDCGRHRARRQRAGLRVRLGSEPLHHRLIPFL